MIFSSLDYIKQDIEFQQQLLEKYRNRLKKYSDLGKCSLTANIRNGKTRYYKTYYSNGKEHRLFLGADKYNERIALQEKHYLQIAIRGIEKNLYYLNLARKNYLSLDPESIATNEALAYRDVEAIQKLLYKFNNTSEWKSRKLREKALHPPYKPEGLRHTAIDGTTTRSKSETSLCDYFYMSNIPYIYECPMTLNGKWILPDFVIFDKKHQREIIIEHLGMLNSESYRADQYEKIDTYISCGYQLNYDLILTSEDLDGNINLQAIVSVIQNALSQN